MGDYVHETSQLSRSFADQTFQKTDETIPQYLSLSI